MLILEIIATETDHGSKSILGFPKKIKNSIQLIYNVEENSIYYKDNNKLIKTKKDFSRSIELVHEIAMRLSSFSIGWEMTFNDVEKFINTSMYSLSKNDALTLILGSVTTNPEYLLQLMETLKVVDGTNRTNISNALHLIIMNANDKRIENLTLTQRMYKDLDKIYEKL